jgi:hypothetical protein
MKVVMNVSSRNENDDGGCVLACIDLTPQLVELALRRVETLAELQAQDQNADEIYYWNYDAVFFDPLLDSGGSPEGASTTASEQLLDRLEKAANDFVEVDGKFHIPEGQIAAIECGQMIVRPEGVAFVAIPKHASFYVETAEVPAEVLHRAAKLS